MVGGTFLPVSLGDACAHVVYTICIHSWEIPHKKKLVAITSEEIPDKTEVSHRFLMVYVQVAYCTTFKV